MSCCNVQPDMDSREGLKKMRNKLDDVKKKGLRKMSNKLDDIKNTI